LKLPNPKRFLAAAGAAAATATAAFAAPPSDYYSTITNQVGEDLKDELHAIISGQRGYSYNQLTYDDARVAMSNSVDNVGNGLVRLFYTNERRAASEWPGNQSREHTWPQSLGADVFPKFSDLHHLFLCDATINSTRGNMIFGDVSGGTAVDNPTGDPDDQNYFSGGVWEVSPNHRGDAARAILYMDVRYSDFSLVDRGETPGNNEMGYLSDLLAWHQQDPVNQFELDRNDAAFSFQNNRNPFVDHPEWVELIYDPPSATDGDSVQVAAQDAAPPTVAQGDTAGMIQLTLTAETNEWYPGLLVVENTGSVADSDLTAFVYEDDNVNGMIDAGEAELGSSSFTSGAATITLAPAPRSTPSVPVNLLIAGQPSFDASTGASMQLRLRENSIVHSALGGNDTDPTHPDFTSGTALIEAAADAGVFISEYVEGSSLNKAIEIYNGTLDPVNLSGWALEFYFNGGTDPLPAGGISLNGTIPSRGVFVISDDEADSGLLSKADQTSNSTFFNGNDAIILRNAADEVIDSFGRVGEDPGSAWTSGDVTTQDAVLRRKPSVLMGDPVFNDAFDPAVEWDAFDASDYTGVGAHQVDQPASADSWVFF